jgi:hypothetical protein
MGRNYICMVDLLFISNEFIGWVFIVYFKKILKCIIK